MASHRLRKSRVAAMMALLLPALLVGAPTPAAAQTPLKTPVNVNLPAGDYFAVVSTDAGVLSLAAPSGVTRTFGYPDDFTGPEIGFEGSAAEIRAALRSLTFTLDGGASLATAEITVSIARKPVEGSREFFYNPDNGHYYEVVDTDAAITWAAARTGAAALSIFNGALTGYLATITSVTESAFILEKIDGEDLWFGASDEFATVNAALPNGATPFADQTASEGKWYWVTGPEAGTQFWEGNASGTPVGGEFNAWKQPIEPNNSGAGEHFAIVNYSCGGFCTATNNWNDFAGDNASVEKYIVEFGGLGDLTFDPIVVDTDIRVASLLAQPTTGPALECTPDPVAVGGTVTVRVTRADPEIDFVWKAMYGSTAVASAVLRTDAAGEGSFAFVVPPGAQGQTMSAQLVDWGTSCTIAVAGTVVPTRLPAGEGPTGPAPLLLVAMSMLVTGALANRLRARTQH